MGIINHLKSTALYAESWNVAFRFGYPGMVFNDKKKSFNIIANSIRFWVADPMVFEYNGLVYIFAELYDYKLCRGTIGYTVFDGEKYGKWKQIIVEDYHLSYPFVFIKNGDVLMIPESSEAEKLLLYRATDFPDKWEQVKEIASGVKWVDTTLHNDNDRILAFTEKIGHPVEDLKLCLDDELNILSTEVLFSDSNSYRCGGRVFSYEDNIVRVCQDCNEGYGIALLFRLCKTDLSEELKCIRISPDNLKYDKKLFLDGMHTYSAIDKMEVIDIKTRRLNLINLFFRCVNKYRKLKKSKEK